MKYTSAEAGKLVKKEVTNYGAVYVKAAYGQTAETLAKLQLALDTVNTTETMDIEVNDI